MDVNIWSRYHPSMVLWSLSNEILWPHSVESSARSWGCKWSYCHNTKLWSSGMLIARVCCFPVTRFFFYYGNLVCTLISHLILTAFYSIQPWLYFWSGESLSGIPMFAILFMWAAFPSCFLYILPPRPLQPFGINSECSVSLGSSPKQRCLDSALNKLKLKPVQVRTELNY
jgi:hypothetical protein